jgi:hypothetical protein
MDRPIKLCPISRLLNLTLQSWLMMSNEGIAGFKFADYLEAWAQSEVVTDY